MKFASRKRTWEVILLIFMLLLVLYTLFCCLFRDSEVWGLLAFLVLIAACQGALLWFRQEYEMTDEELIIHEKKPLKDKHIPYEAVTEYHLVFRRWFFKDRPNLPKDVYLAYSSGKRKRVDIISPDDADGFVAEFKERRNKQSGEA